MQLPDHLAWNSPCKDMGNPLFTTNDVGSDDIDGEDRIVDGRVDIGADEIYSCDGDLSEDDIYNPLDGNADGLLNFEEFSKFSLAWLAHDPNEPGLTDPNLAARWDAACNLIDTGGSAYCIDLADLVEFMDNGYWLWTACWKANEIVEMQMMSGGGESMQMMIPLTEPFYSAQSLQVESIPVYEPTPATDAKNIAEVLGFLNTLLEDESPENEQAILEIKAVLEDWFDEISATNYEP